MTEFAYNDDELLDQFMEADVNDGWVMLEFEHFSGETASIDVKPCLKCADWHALLKLSDNFISSPKKYNSSFARTVCYLKNKVGIVNLNVCNSNGKYLKEIEVDDHCEFVTFEGQDAGSEIIF
ncbi:MAG: hypothetical protein M3Y53_13100 [Thermoproteota archaeon]|nr:hypothetical protein [Thermoproteota archaeon]